MSKLDYEKGFYDSGELRWETWKLNGKYHNEEGPAFIWYRENGSVWRKWWRLNGVEYSEEEWHEIVFRKAFEKAFEEVL